MKFFLEILIYNRKITIIKSNVKLESPPVVLQFLSANFQAIFAVLLILLQIAESS